MRPIIVLMVLCTSLRARADLTEPSPALFERFDSIARLAEHKQAARRLTRGKTLTAISLIHLSIASACWWAIAGSWLGCHGSCSNDSLVATLPPAGLYSFTGVLFMSIGVPLWVKGARSSRELVRADAGGVALTF